MTANHFLGQYISAEKVINSKLAELSRLRALAQNATLAFENDRVQTSPSDRLGRIVAKIVDLEREIDEDVDRLIEKRKEVKNTISSVEDDRLRNILEMRYLAGKKWREISEDLMLDYRWVLRLHRKALKQIKIT